MLNGCCQEQLTDIASNFLYDYHNKHSLCHRAIAYKDVSTDINANGHHYYSLKQKKQPLLPRSYMYIMYPFSKICNKDLATRQLQQIWLSYFLTFARHAYLTIIFDICCLCVREMSFSEILSDRDVLNNRNIPTLMYAYDDFENRRSFMYLSKISFRDVL